MGAFFENDPIKKIFIKFILKVYYNIIWNNLKPSTNEQKFLVCTVFPLSDYFGLSRETSIFWLVSYLPWGSHWLCADGERVETENLKFLHTFQTFPRTVQIVKVECLCSFGDLLFARTKQSEWKKIFYESKAKELKIWVRLAVILTAGWLIYTYRCVWPISYSKDKCFKFAPTIMQIFYIQKREKFHNWTSKTLYFGNSNLYVYVRVHK